MLHCNNEEQMLMRADMEDSTIAVSIIKDLVPFLKKIGFFDFITKILLTFVFWNVVPKISMSLELQEVDFSKQPKMNNEKDDYTSILVV